MKNIYKHIALTLKNLRKKNGWSLDKAAEQTGVSKAMLGQIERQESSPTIAILWKIASGFNVSFSSFLEHSGSTRLLRPANETIHVTPLFPFDPELKSEIFIIDLLPHSEHLSPAHQAGVIEHVLPVNGKMEILINDTWQSVNQGEGLRFNANQPHGYRNSTGKMVRFHLIIHYL